MRFRSIPFRRHATSAILFTIAQASFAAEARPPEIVAVTQAMQNAV